MLSCFTDCFTRSSGHSIDATTLLNSPAASDAVFAQECNRPRASPQPYNKARAVANLYDMLDATPTTRAEILSNTAVEPDDSKIARLIGPSANVEGAKPAGLSVRSPNVQLTPGLTKKGKFSSLEQLLEQSPRTRVGLGPEEDAENDINTMEVSVLVDDAKPVVCNYTPIKISVSNNGRLNKQPKDDETL